MTLALAQSMVNQGWFYAPTSQQQQQQPSSAYKIPSPIVPPSTSNHSNLYNLPMGQHNSRLHKDPAIIVEGPVIATSSPLTDNARGGQQQRRTVDINHVMSSQNTCIPPTPPCIMSNSVALPIVTSSADVASAGGRTVRGRQQGGESRPSPPPSTITISSGGTSDEDIDTSMASSRFV
jgi:hypothetical protein